MNNIKKLFNLSFMFSKKYIKQYFRLLKKPALMSIIGLFSLILCVFGPIGGICAVLISTPCLCYALWQGYLITYSLNYAADALEIDNDISLIDCFEQTKTKAKDLALFLLFASIIYLILLIPSLIILIQSFDISTLKIANYGIIAVIVNGILLIPFSNFWNQAFFYKKNEENYIDLLINCYKKIDKTGISIALIFTAITNLFCFIDSILFIVISLLLNTFIYCANTLWYKSKSIAEQEF